MMSRYKEKLEFVREFVRENIDEVEVFCNTFDITIEDMMEVFTDKLVNQYEILTFDNNVANEEVDEEDPGYEDEED